MDSELARLASRAAEQAETIKALSRETGIADSSLHDAINADPDESYKSHPNDKEKKYRLRQWLQENQTDTYSGPADAERDPQEVTRETLEVRHPADKMRSGPPKTEHNNEDPPNPHITGRVAGRQNEDRSDVVSRQRDLYARRREKERARRRQVVRFDYGPVCLAFQGDEHYGNSGCDIDHALRDAELIASTPGMYAVKLGDFVDNFIVNYLEGKNAKPSLAIEEQWMCAQEHLDILSGHSIAVVGGNHDGWSRLETHLDPLRRMVGDGVLYDADQIEFTLKIGSQVSKDVFLRHQYSKGHSQWNETHELERAAKFDHPGRDIYASAHDHSGLHMKVFAMKSGGYCAAIKTGTYKKFDDYAQRKGYPQYENEEVAGALTIHEDGTMVPHHSLKRASEYMQKFYE